MKRITTNFKGILITLLVLVIKLTIISQNLVPNDDFETFTSCPTGSSQNTLTPPWTQPNNTTGSADYMNACFTGGNSGQGTPVNFYGTQAPLSGNGYYGIITYYGPQEVREYLTVPLTSPLVAGTTYDVGFYVSLADNFVFATDGFGAYLSNTAPNGSGTFTALNVTAQVINPSGNVLNDPINWTLVSGTYTAVGNENFLTIGNFRSDANITATTFNGTSTLNWAYYYVDDAFVIPSSQDLQIIGDSEICIGDTTTLTAINDSIFAWADSLNPSAIISTDSFITVSPSVTTTYLVYGTSDTASHTLIVNPLPIVDLGNDTALCTGETLTLDANINNASYLWQDNSILPNYTVNQSGIYSVEVIDTNNCSNTDTIAISYLQSPTVNLGNDTSLCTGDSLMLDATQTGATHLWHDNSTNSSFKALTTGDYFVEISQNGCIASDTISIVFNGFPAGNLGNDTTLCNGESIILDASIIGGSYLWQDNSTQPTLNVNTAGTYWADITANGCKSSDTIVVNYNPLPFINLGNDTILCENDSLMLDITTPNATYLWNDNSLAPTYTISQAGDYWASITVDGCSSSDSITVDYIPLPIIDIGNDTIVCEETIVVLDATYPNATYLWQDNSTNPVFVVVQQGNYSVELTTSCATIKDSIFIQTNNCNCNFYIPNSFTPNNDNTNDKLEIVNNCEFLKYELFLFNRWGEQIFTSIDIKDVWDGTYKGVNCPLGSYPYILRYKIVNEVEEKVKRGHIILLR